MLGMQTQSAFNVVLQHEASAVTLPRGDVLVGRSIACFLSLDDPGVSRLHFKIVVSDAVAIEDLGSTNGTRVNGQLLTGRRPLKDGDQIGVGRRVFRVRFVPASTSFDEGDVTPFPEEHTRDTLQGTGRVVLDETCPHCGGRVPTGTSSCPACGHRWPAASRPQAITEREAPVVYCRRRHERYPRVITASYTSGFRELRGQIQNISHSGLFFACEQADSVGARCVIRVQDGDGTPVALEGFVRHAIHRGQERGMGIEFTSLSPEGEAWLAGQLERAVSGL